MKTCLHCNQERPASAFNRDLSKADGLQSLCRQCHKGRRSLHRAKDSARFATWRIFNGFKKAAHRAVEQALKSGALTKPANCMRCNKSARLDAHHSDYERPMEVLFLCRPCHAAIHNEEKRATAQVGTK